MCIRLVHTKNVRIFHGNTVVCLVHVKPRSFLITETWKVDVFMLGWVVTFGRAKWGLGGWSPLTVHVTTHPSGLSVPTCSYSLCRTDVWGTQTTVCLGPMFSRYSPESGEYREWNYTVSPKNCSPLTYVNHFCTDDIFGYCRRREQFLISSTYARRLSENISIRYT